MCSRSRTLLANSIRLRRRMGISPPAIFAARSASRSPLWIQSTTGSNSSGVGRGSSSGGITPRLIMSTASFHRSATVGALKSDGSWSIRNPAFARFGPWQRRQ